MKEIAKIYIETKGNTTIFHVIGLDFKGKVIHEKFLSRAAAQRWVAAKFNPQVIIEEVV